MEKTRPIQFGIGTAMVVVTGVSIMLSLSIWNPVFGGPTSITLTCGLWATAAFRAGYRRLAYYLIATGIGPIALAVAATPFLIAIIAKGIPPSTPEDWWVFALVLPFVVATLVTTRLLGERIRQPGGWACVNAGVYCVSVTAMVI